MSALTLPFGAVWSAPVAPATGALGYRDVPSGGRTRPRSSGSPPSVTKGYAADLYPSAEASAAACAS